MYHSNNPRVVEIPDDVDHVESMSYAPGRVTVTFVLKDSKTFTNPTMLFATNGVESRLLEPTITKVEHIVNEPQQDTAQPVEMLQNELQAQEEEAKVETPKKSRGKKSEDIGD